MNETFCSWKFCREKCNPCDVIPFKNVFVVSRRTKSIFCVSASTCFHCLGKFSCKETKVLRAAHLVIQQSPWGLVNMLNSLTYLWNNWEGYFFTFKLLTNTDLVVKRRFLGVKIHLWRMGAIPWQLIASSMCAWARRTHKTGNPLIKGRKLKSTTRGQRLHGESF